MISSSSSSPAPPLCTRRPDPVQGPAIPASSPPLVRRPASPDSTRTGNLHLPAIAAALLPVEQRTSASIAHWGQISAWPQRKSTARSSRPASASAFKASSSRPIPAARVLRQQANPALTRPRAQCEQPLLAPVHCWVCLRFGPVDVFSWFCDLSI